MKSPQGDAPLTGSEFVEQILDPLARFDALAGRIKVGHRVAGVTRAGLNKGDYAGHPIRSERPFRLLTQTPEGEQDVEADAVLDASGTFGRAAALGIGGIAARGEHQLGTRIIRDLGELHRRLSSLGGKRILVARHGHSAANAIGHLALLAERDPQTRVVWASRSLNRRPCTEVASDPLPERRRVVAFANDAAASPPSWLRVERRATVESIAVQSDGSFCVVFGGQRAHVVDEIVGLTGYRPDLSFLSELAIEIDPGTEGAARLARALSNTVDFLSIPAVAPADLASGEPGFHLIGAKSYGRSRTFLLQAGYAQLESILEGLGEPNSL